MKKFIIALSCTLSLNSFADALSDAVTAATESVSNVSAMVEIINNVFTQKNYTSFSTVPNSGQTNVSVNIKGSWVGGTDGVNDFIANFKVVFGTSAVAIPAGFPNAGDLFTKKITLYALDHNIDLGCTSTTACITVDFDETLKRGHGICTWNGNGTQDADGVDIFNSLSEVFYDKTTSVNYLKTQMLDKCNYVINACTTPLAFALAGSDGSYVLAADPTSFTDFAYDQASGTSLESVLENLFGLQ